MAAAPGLLIDGKCCLIAVIQDSWTISPTLFNEVRVGFSRFFLDRNNTTIDTQPAWVNAPLLGDSDFQSY